MKHTLTSNYFRRVILVVFFSFLIILAEGTLHIFSPTVGLIETEYDFYRIEVNNNLEGAIVYTFDVDRTYWITLPTHIVRNIDLRIANPSNFSIYDSAQLGTWERNLYSIDIESDPQLVVTPETSVKGEIDYYDVNVLQNASKNTLPYVRLRYKDQLDLDLIETIGPTEKNLGNGSLSVTISLIINNTLDLPLGSSDYALFETENYGNMTSVMRLNNGTELASPWIIDHNGWVRTAFSVKPHTSLKMTVTCVFEELTP